MFEASANGKSCVQAPSTHGVRAGLGTDNQGGYGMYQFSRSIYRELAPRVVADEEDPTATRNRQIVLDACEAAIQRMTYDGRYFANPARWLFGEVRPYIRMTEQVHAWRVVEMNIGLAAKFLAKGGSEGWTAVFHALFASADFRYVD